MSTVCPHCGAVAESQSTELGVLCSCHACGLEWADALTLDFVTD